MSHSFCSRRGFTAAAAGGLLTGCGVGVGWQVHWNIRLTARPGGAVTPCEPGLHPLKIRKERDSLLYVPKSAAADKPAPLLVYLHGANGSEQQGIRRLSPRADELGFLLLSPASEGGTWDAIRGGYGPDVSAIDQSLTRAFAMRQVDAARIAAAGFSDGASYALGLGLSNGDLFTALVAFSPGFIPPGSAKSGKPRIFVSHGTEDSILPITTCSRRLVPELQHAGYAVTYREFAGPHTVPPEIAKEALRWFVG